MRIVTLSEVQSDLQALADQVGEDGFIKAKGLYLEKVAVTKEDGTPLKAEELEIVMMPKMDKEEEEKAMEEDEEKADEEKEDKREEEEDKHKPKAIEIGVPRRKAVSTIARSARPSYRPSVYSKTKNFRDDSHGDGVDKAIRFGHWLMASNGSRKSLNFCDRQGIEVKAHTEGVNSAGGFLVPDEFERELISLREEFGVFRKEARNRTMQSDTLRIPRRSATLTANFVGEATAATESTMTFEQVNLIAKKVACITTVSNELSEDSMINLADDVAGEISYAFAKKEDECGFTGDGSSTFGGILGVIPTLEAGTNNVTFSTTAAGRADVTDLTDAEVSAFMALLPQFADTPSAKLYMHKGTWHAGFERLLATNGGTSGVERSNGFQPTFLGYPVVFSQVMPNMASSAGLSADGIVAVFGDLSQAASFGDRRQTTIQVSDSALNAFEQDEMAIRGTERFDINVHDIGSSTEAGPIVGLKLDIA
mgnify:CR=1 FL=1